MKFKILMAVAFTMIGCILWHFDFRYTTKRELDRLEHRIKALEALETQR